MIVVKMPKKLKQLFKYKCMEVMCNTTHRKDKWLEHCKKKHAYKFRHNLNISFKMVEVKSGDGPWVKYTDAESSADPSTCLLYTSRCV